MKIENSKTNKADKFVHNVSQRLDLINLIMPGMRFLEALRTGEGRG